MNGKLGSILVGAVIAALIMGAAALGAIFARPNTIQAAQTGVRPVRQITVVGTGEAKASPDRATVQLGVRSQAQTASDAMAANTRDMNALVDQLKKLGIADKDLQTSNFSITPTHDAEGRTVTGYEVTNTVAVIIRDLKNAGTLLDKVVSAGANTVYGLGFSIDNPKALQAAARNNAIADAQAQAQEIAKAAGGTVGQILSITENIGAPPQPLMMERAAAAQSDAGGAPPIATGEQTVNAQVQITYELR